MALNLDKGSIIERDTKLLFHGGHTIQASRKEYHLFVPWNEKKERNLMYQIKSLILEKGRAYIPFMNRDGSPAIFDPESIKVLSDQIHSSGQSVQLIMSNKSSIHVLRVKSLFYSRDCLDVVSIKSFCNEKYTLFFEVDDIYVLEANHLDDESRIDHVLHKFLFEGSHSNIFKPIINFNLKMNKVDKRWVDRNRSLTYEYLIHSRELKNNIFYEDWDFLSVSTQHELVSCELQKQIALTYRGSEKWVKLHQAFRNYEEAVISELNDIYINPFMKSLCHFETLVGAWKVTSESYVGDKDTIIFDLFSGKKNEIKTIEQFLEFIHQAKSFYYSLKKQFTKKIHKEEFLIVENFLNHQEGLVDSFHCKKIAQKLDLILEIKKWIKHVTHSDIPDKAYQQNECNLKLSHFLNSLLSTNAQDNIFYHLIAEKIGRAVFKASLGDQVKKLFEEEKLTIKIAS